MSFSLYKRLLAMIFISVLLTSCSERVQILTDLTNLPAAEEIITNPDISISIPNAPSVVLVGSTGSLVAVLTPTPTDDVDVKIIWSTSDESFLSIDESGAYRAIKEGGPITVRATAMLTIDSRTSIYTEEVEISITDTSVPAESITIDDAPSSIIIGDTGMLTATVLPAVHTSGQIRWATEGDGESDILQIDTNTGVYKAIGAGEIDVIASINGVSPCLYCINVISDTVRIEVIERLQQRVLSLEIFNIPDNRLSSGYTFMLGINVETTHPSINFDGRVQWEYPNSKIVLLGQREDNYATFQVLETGHGEIMISANVEHVSDSATIKTKLPPTRSMISIGNYNISHSSSLVEKNQGYFNVEHLADVNTSQYDSIEYSWSFSYSKSAQEICPNDEYASLTLSDTDSSFYTLNQEGCFYITVRIEGTKIGATDKETIDTITSNQLVVFPYIYVETQPWAGLSYTSSVDLQGNDDIYYENGKWKKIIAVNIESSEKGKDITSYDRAYSAADLSIHGSKYFAPYIRPNPILAGHHTIQDVLNYEIIDNARYYNNRSNYEIEMRLNDETVRETLELSQFKEATEPFSFLSRPARFTISEGKVSEMELTVYFEYVYYPHLRQICNCISCSSTNSWY